MDDFRQIICCNKVARLFEAIDYDEIQFIKDWLHSEVNRQIIELEPAVISQGILYWKECFSEEYPLRKEDRKIIPDAMFWLGYILTYMQYSYSMTGVELWDRYDIIEVLKFYDVLHTQSSKIASEDIMKSFVRGEVENSDNIH